ncbi:hypothetical protein JA1_002099 [Spathaspora sp. JA1]|nr:hypothetical protein JA1_002099 [Spathaspora sp. JA1]
MDKLKRNFLQDDFFSLSSTVDKKKRKKEKKHTKQNRHIEEGDVTNSEGTTTDFISDINSSTILHEESLQKEPRSYKNNDPGSESDDGEQAAIIPKPPIRARTITPPPIDKESIRSQVAFRIKSTGSSSTPALEDTDDDNDDESDDELVDIRFLKESKKSFLSSERSLDEYEFTNANEKKRRYIIRVISKLPVPQQGNTPVDFGTGGLKSFTKIKLAMINQFRTIFSSALPPHYLDRYSPETSALVWLEGKMLVPSFYTPKTLRIPPPTSFNPVIEKVENMPPTVFTCLLIEKENSEKFMNIYPEFQTSAPIIDDIPDIPQEQFEESADSEEEEEEDDEEDDIIDLTLEQNPTTHTKEVDEFFVIGLKGRDNKRIEVKVSNETKIKKLLLHYLKVKGLDERTVDISNAKVIFDDEALSMDDSVGDTELEEDFEVQIVI